MATLRKFSMVVFVVIRIAEMSDSVPEIEHGVILFV